MEGTIDPALRAGPYIVREIAYTPGYRQEKHAHPLLGITLVLSGSIREWVGRREEYGQPLSVVVKPADVEHANEVGPNGARTIQIAVRPDAELPAGFEAWRWQHVSPSARAMLRLVRLARNGSDEGAVEESIADALGLLEPESRAESEPPDWLRRVREAVEDAPEEASVRELARAAGVHEATLSRAFRRHFGTTIRALRRRARLRRAAAAIDRDSAELSRIAHATGFADHAHLCRDFRRATGMTPSHFRSLVR